MTANINELRAIFEIDEIFFMNFLKRNVIFHIGKVENAGEKEIKEKEESQSFNYPKSIGSCERLDS